MSAFACQCYRAAVLRAWALQCAGDALGAQREIGWAIFWWSRHRLRRHT